MLDNNATVFCTLKMTHCHRKYPASRIVHYHPFANDLAVLEPPHSDRIAKMNRAARIIDEMKDRFVALGIGTQSEFSKVKKNKTSEWPYP